MMSADRYRGAQWCRPIYIPDYRHNRVTMIIPTSFKQRSMIM